MPKHRKKAEDVNQTAHRVVAEATGESGMPGPPKTKNPAAVELGRMGGLKGGRARARNLSPERRSQIASEAAKKRWKDKGDEAV